ncbi:MAG: hypothetical protein HYZ26_09600 [Chloroflexi bacterium]|nr:hypothetical protein [Chloroflexota bacterium]
MQLALVGGNPERFAAAFSKIMGLYRISIEPLCQTASISNLVTRLPIGDVDLPSRRDFIIALQPKIGPIAAYLQQFTLLHPSNTPHNGYVAAGEPSNRHI